MKAAPRCFAGFVAGALVALCSWLAPRCGPLGPGAAEVWVADRDDDRVVALDRDLYRVRAHPIRAPVALAVRADGELWVASAAERHPLGAHRIVRLGVDGAERAAAKLGPVLALVADGGGDALVLSWPDANERSARVVRVNAAGEIRELVRLPGASALAGAGDAALAGGRGGALVLVAAHDGAVRARATLGGEIGALAAAEGAGWWALDVAGTGRLVRLDARLAVLSSVELGVHAHELAPAGESVWIVDGAEPLARRYGARGALELEVASLPLVGWGGAVAWHDDACLIAAPGALLHVGRDGALLPGQGGFRFLVDVARVPP